MWWFSTLRQMSHTHTHKAQMMSPTSQQTTDEADTSQHTIICYYCASKTIICLCPSVLLHHMNVTPSDNRPIGDKQLTSTVSVLCTHSVNPASKMCDYWFFLFVCLKVPAEHGGTKSDQAAVCTSCSLNCHTLHVPENKAVAWMKNKDFHQRGAKEVQRMASEEKQCYLWSDFRVTWISSI